MNIYHCHWPSGRGIMLTEKLLDNQSVTADVFMLSAIEYFHFYVLLEDTDHTQRNIAVM